MTRFSLVGSMICSFFALSLHASTVQAFLPPLPIPMKQRVEMSSHIFVGQVEKVHFIDQTGKVISPRQAAYLMREYNIPPCLETQLRVVEPLLWKSRRREKFVLLRDPHTAPYGVPDSEGTEVLQDHLAWYKQEAGKKYVYLTKAVVHPGRRTFFVASYFPDREEMAKKAEIQKAIQQVRLSPPTISTAPRAVLQYQQQPRLLAQ